MIPILTRLFPIRIVESRKRGFSKSLKMRFLEPPLSFWSLLRSLCEIEKKATSEPDSKAEHPKSRMIMANEIHVAIPRGSEVPVRNRKLLNKPEGYGSVSNLEFFGLTKGPAIKAGQIEKVLKG